MHLLHLIHIHAGILACFYAKVMFDRRLTRNDMNVKLFMHFEEFFVAPRRDGGVQDRDTDFTPVWSLFLIMSAGFQHVVEVLDAIHIARTVRRVCEKLHVEES
ncbi:hypothetical protein K439DRAFT_1622833 [Ramaria rubella]|nr:hypothetical protein K439DRAFT_1622833 [Ramaria rubella]